MVIRILKSSASFQAIDYNENKNKIGESQLLVADNFRGLDVENSRPIDLKNYMNAVSNLNTSIKRKQFHATISVKGKSKTPEELKNYAITYLKEMGYANNPYLIYSHKDTPNNHVHIISTRVDYQGRKIDDSYENIRTQKILKEKFNISHERNPKKDESIINIYSVNNTKQYALLWEQLGYKTQFKNDTLSFFQTGKKVHEIKEQSIVLSTALSKKSNLVKSHYAKFLKYSAGSRPEEFKALMHKHFGLEIIFHQSKGKETPYGYSVIDHHNKIVFKGSTLFPLKGILKGLERELEIHQAKQVINEILNTTIGISEFKNFLKNRNLYVLNNGTIYLDSSKQPIYQLNRKELQVLFKQELITKGRDVNFYSNASKKAFYSYLGIKGHSNGTQLKANPRLIASYQSLLTNSLNPKNIREKGFEVFKQDNAFYLWDKNNNLILNTKDELKVSQDLTHLTTLSSNKERVPDSNTTKEQLAASINALIQNFDNSNDEEEDEIMDQKRKRKKYPKR